MAGCVPRTSFAYATIVLLMFWLVNPGSSASALAASLSNSSAPGWWPGAARWERNGVRFGF